MPALVHEPYLGLDSLHPLPELPGWSDEARTGLPIHLSCWLEALFLDFRFITANLVIYSPFRELFYLSK